MRRNNKGFTLAEVMLVVAFLAFIIAIAIPAFLRARELGRMRACQEQLQKIHGAKQQWALENNQPVNATPTWANLIGVERYLRKTPSCPGGGTYTIGQVNDDTVCSLGNNGGFPHEIDAPGSGGS